MSRKYKFKNSDELYFVTFAVVFFPYNPNITSATNSTKLYKLNGASGAKTGLGIVLKVMSGDVVNIYGKSYYHLNTGQQPNNSYLISGALINLLGAFASTSAVTATHSGVTGGVLNNTPATTTPLPGWLNGSVHTPVSNVPKAYINWLFLDEQFKPVTTGMSGASPVATTSDKLKPHTISPVSIIKNGYLYVYCSNESNIDVFFDNLQVIHTRGPLVSEDHYYPFGLTMSGISSQALNFGQPDNKKKYNGIEFNEDFDLDIYDANLRNLDPQIGRWWQIDPKIENMEAWSPYASNYDNPISFKDPLGDDPITGTIKLARFIWGLIRLSDAVNSSKPLTFDDVLASYAPISIDKAQWMKSVDKLGAEIKIDKEVNSLEKSNNSLIKRIDEHEQKLEDYQKDPDKNDNKDLLKNATPEQRKNIIEKRVNHLKEEIKTFKDNIQKNNKQIENLKKAKEDLIKQK